MYSLLHRCYSTLLECKWRRLSVGADHMLSETSQWTQNGTMFVDLDWIAKCVEPVVMLSFLLEVSLLCQTCKVLLVFTWFCMAVSFVCHCSRIVTGALRACCTFGVFYSTALFERTSDDDDDDDDFLQRQPHHSRLFQVCECFHFTGWSKTKCRRLKWNLIRDLCDI